VRFEVRTALEQGVRVVPVLVDGAKPPRPQELPAELHRLARLNASELSYGRYQYDADRLLDLIQRVLEEAERQAREEAEHKLQEQKVEPQTQQEAEEAFRLGDRFRQRSDFAGAEAAYREAIRLDPGLASARTNLDNMNRGKSQNAPP
jgi:tetratricopeptide (TPR) repeat protein